MAYWWANQNENFERTFNGGYLWVPLPPATPRNPFFWVNMKRVQIGDIIFCYVNQEIRALGAAKTLPYAGEEPDRRRAKAGKPGLKIDVAYQCIACPLVRDSFLLGVMPLLPNRNSPLTADGASTKECLYELPERAGRFLSHLTFIAGDSSAFERAVADTAESAAEKTALIQSRSGRGQFKTAVRALWQNRCAATGIRNSKLLRASHIRPWRDSNNSERLDPNNGILLSPVYFSAFDRGLITFDGKGHIEVSSVLDEVDRRALGINNELVIPLNPKQRKYMADHNSSVFLGN